MIPRVKALKHPGHIMSYEGGHCMLLSSGQACGYPMKGTHAKYGCFAYSSAFGYSVPPGLFSLEQYALASQLGFSDDGGEYWKARRKCEYAGLETRGGVPVLVSRWRPFPDVVVKTILVPPQGDAPNWHLRIHHVSAGREVMAADGGFAVRNVSATTGRYLDLWDEAAGEGTSVKIMGSYDLATPEAWASGADGAFAVSLTAGASGVRALEMGVRRAANLVNADPNSNLMENRTAIPTLQNTFRKGESAWVVTAVYARPAGEGVARESYLEGWKSPPAVPSWLEKEEA